MADFPYTDRRQFNVQRYIKDYGNDCQTTWEAATTASEADVIVSNPYGYVQFGQQFVYGVGTQRYIIDRCLCSYNLAGMNPAQVVAAYLLSEGGWVTEEEGMGIYMVDGTGLSGTDKGTFSEIPNCPILGFGRVGKRFDFDNPWGISFDADGIAFLKSKAGGIAKIGFYSSEAASPGNCPTVTGRELLFLEARVYGTHKIVTVEARGGYIWVEGTYLAYLDFYRTKRLKEGTTTGTTGKIAGHLWVEGNYLHYIDANGDERRILGSTTGLSGKLAGQITVNYFQGGTELCYIDSSGNERCFEGSAS